MRGTQSGAFSTNQVPREMRCAASGQYTQRMRRRSRSTSCSPPLTGTPTASPCPSPCRNACAPDAGHADATHSRCFLVTSSASLLSSSDHVRRSVATFMHLSSRDVPHQPSACLLPPKDKCKLSFTRGDVEVLQITMPLKLGGLVMSHGKACPCLPAGVSGLRLLRRVAEAPARALLCRARAELGLLLPPGARQPLLRLPGTCASPLLRTPMWDHSCSPAAATAAARNN